MNGAPNESYTSFVNGLGPAQVPMLGPSGLGSGSHGPSPMLSNVPAQAAHTQFHASPAHSHFEDATGSLANRPGGPVSQSWATDFASFMPKARNDIASGPDAYRQQLPAPHYGPQSMSSQHQYHQGFAGFHPFNGAPAVPNATYMTSSMSMPQGWNAQHIQQGQGTATAEAEFDDAMSRWMALNDHAEDVGDTQAGSSTHASRDGELGATEGQATRSSVLANESTAMQVNATTPVAGNGSLPDMSELTLGDARHDEVSASDQQGMELPPKSEVSEAARQLLETVSHEEGEKWQRSKFLTLMREFRDGTKNIVDDQIEETGKGTQSHT